MSEVTYINRKIREFESSPQFDGYSRVVIVVSEDLEYSAGTETGRTLTITNPWGTQAMADNILANIRGFQYQPYTAKDAILDPAAELGDGIGVNGVYGGIYTMDTTFGSNCRATVSAPAEEEIDHEFPYVPSQERKVTRKMASLSAELKVQAGLISAEVSELRTDTDEIKGQLSIQAGQISAKVSKTGGEPSSFGWNLGDSYWELLSNNSTVLRADQSGLEVRGKITALSGTIGGFDIQADHLSYNNQTWGGTNTLGAYLGVNGLQLGKHFKVDMSGNLYAARGTFSGSVYAGNIQHGGNYGTISGSALTSYSVPANCLVPGSITPTYTSEGIQMSLGYADYAYGVLNGWNKGVKASFEQLSVKEMLLWNPYRRVNTMLDTSLIQYLDADGKPREMKVVTWRIR